MPVLFKEDSLKAIRAWRLEGPHQRKSHLVSICGRCSLVRQSEGVSSGFIQEVLADFCFTSSLKVNLAKSRVFAAVGVS